MAEIIGYCRVSTGSQSLDIQIEQLKAAGATTLFKEKMSGARSDRPQLLRAIDALGKGDTLLVSKIDRLARSTLHLLTVLEEVKKRGATFKSLGDPWIDTSSPMGEFMMTVLAGVATLERHLIKARTDAGIQRAREAGVRFGRPGRLTKHQQQKGIEMLEADEPQAEIARIFDCGQATISRLWTRHLQETLQQPIPN
jgi:DNA invertase Pin-like site-specific DNA recombinase